MGKDTKNDPILLGPEPLSRWAQVLLDEMRQEIGYWQAQLPDQRLHLLWMPSFKKSAAAMALTDHLGEHVLPPKKARQIVNYTVTYGGYIDCRTFNKKQDFVLACSGYIPHYCGPAINFTVDNGTPQPDRHAVQHRFVGFSVVKMYMLLLLKVLGQEVQHPDLPRAAEPALANAALTMARIIHRCGMRDDPAASEKKWQAYASTITHAVVLDCIDIKCRTDAAESVLSATTSDDIDPITHGLAMLEMAAWLNADPKRRQGLFKLAKSDNDTATVAGIFANTLGHFDNRIPLDTRFAFVNDWTRQAHADYAAAEHDITLTREELHKTPNITELTGHAAPLMSFARFAGRQRNQFPQSRLYQLLDAATTTVLSSAAAKDYDTATYVDGQLAKMRRQGVETHPGLLQRGTR